MRFKDSYHFDRCLGLLKDYSYWWLWYSGALPFYKAEAEKDRSLYGNERWFSENAKFWRSKIDEIESEIRKHERLVNEELRMLSYYI